MTTEQIAQYVVSILPSIIAVLTTIGVVIKTLKQFADLKKQVTDMKAIEDVKSQLKMILQENYELKKTLNEAMTKVDHVDRS